MEIEDRPKVWYIEEVLCYSDVFTRQSPYDFWQHIRIRVNRRNSFHKLDMIFEATVGLPINVLQGTPFWSMCDFRNMFLKSLESVIFEISALFRWRSRIEKKNSLSSIQKHCDLCVHPGKFVGVHCICTEKSDVLEDLINFLSFSSLLAVHDTGVSHDTCSKSLRISPYAYCFFEVFRYKTSGHRQSLPWPSSLCIKWRKKRLGALCHIVLFLRTLVCQQPCQISKEATIRPASTNYASVFHALLSMRLSMEYLIQSFPAQRDLWIGKLWN